MNNFKNLVIFVLSIIVIIQGVMLINFVSRRAVQKKAVLPIAVSETEKKIVPAKGVEVARRPEPAIKPVPVLGRIALVIDDWGYTLRNKDFITDNSYRVTLSVIPFEKYSTQIALLAHQYGKEVIVHMPMEPHNKEQNSLEANTLMVDMDRPTVMRLLRNAFDSVPYAKGANNHMGSAATENVRLMRIVMQYLKERDFFFLDSLVTSNSVCRGVAKRLSLKFARRDIFIDNESDTAYIRSQLVKLAEKAKTDGSAVGIGHDRPNTIAVLKEMIPRLEKEGYQFINVSELESVEN